MPPMFWYLAAAIFVVAAGLILLTILLQGREFGKEAVKPLSKDYDEKCLRASLAQEVTKDIPSLLGEDIKRADIDLDDRDDILCDWCVCPAGEGCHNDRDDDDGDKLPKRCEMDEDQNKTTVFAPECVPMKNTKFGTGTQCWFSE